MLAAGGPAIFLLGLEGALRLTGCGHPTAFFLDREVNGQAVWVDNWQFGWRFFTRGSARRPHPVVMPKEKPAGTIRIFVLGESAALGDPAPQYGFSRMLQVLLRERFPDRRFEVVNASMVAINSHVILPIARDCAGRDGDLWVIYMGNNEVIGPFGAQGVFGARVPPLPVVHANLALKATRIGQLLDAGLERLRVGHTAQQQWRGMQMFNEAMSRDDPGISRVHANFRENLAAILKVGQQAGLPIILCTVACNLKDCSPFASRHRPGLTPAQQAEWEQVYQTGVTREAQGNFADARAQYQVAARLDDRFADLQFRLGRCGLALGQAAEARKHFRRAKDEDALQFRPDTRLNEIIRQLAATQSAQRVHLLDAEELFDRRSPDGLPGDEWFFEHVHLTPAGNYLLAQAAAEMAAGMIPGGDRPGTATNSVSWLSQGECEERLGLTEWGLYQTLEELQKRLEEPPFTSQIIHSNQVEKVRAELKRRRRALRPVALRSAVQQVQAAVARNPGDAELLQILAGMLEAAGDRSGAERQRREVIRLLPHDSLPYLNLAQVLDRQGRTDEAALAYEECLRRNPDTTEARGNLGLVRLRQGRAAEAIPHLRVVVRQQPESVAGHFQLGMALQRINRRTEAATQFKQALQLDPNHAEAKRALEEVSIGK